MTKAVKEFLLDQGTGEVNVEYSDNTTTSFNLANAVTATQSAQGVVNDIGSIAVGAASVGAVLTERAANYGPQVWGIIGDSRTYNSHITNGGAAGTWPAGEVATTRDDLGMNGFAHHLQALSGGAIIMPRSCNFGVAGQRTWEILARADAAIVGMRAAGAVGVVILCGTNDRGASGITHLDTIANLVALRDKFLAAGIAAAIIAEEPRGDSTFTASRLTTALLKEHMMVRKAILGMHNGKTVFAVDAWGKVADLSSATGDALLGYTYDGLHQNGVMAHKVAKTLWDGHLSKITPAFSWAPAGAADEYSVTNTSGSINFNPCVTGTGGTLGTNMTGELAASYVGGNVPANATIAASKTTDSEGAANQQFVIGSTGSITSTAVDLMRKDTNVGTNGVTVGKKVRAVACLDIDAGHSGLYEIDVYAGSGSMNVRAGASSSTFTDTKMQADAVTAGVFITEPMTIPEGATSVRLGVRAYFAGGTAAATVRVKWIKLVHVSSEFLIPAARNR